MLQWVQNYSQFCIQSGVYIYKLIVYRYLMLQVNMIRRDIYTAQFKFNERIYKICEDRYNVVIM